MPEADVSRAFTATDLDEQRANYDNWAEDYERELCAMGYRVPAVVASVFVNFAPDRTVPILDAGCGGGIQAEPLALLGFNAIVGIDLSAGMLAIAHQKSIYCELHQMTLGERLDFADNSFAAVLSCGAITPKHAPPHTFDELIRVARPGAPVVFSLRDDPGQEPEYPAALARLEASGAWSPVFRSNSFRSLPYGDKGQSHRVHVYRIAP